MRHWTTEVLALLQERQLNAHLRDVCFALGDEALHDTEYAPLPLLSMLLPR
jgi:hypothetical protein